MERQLQTHYTATLSHSFSMPSLAEGSEPISEVEEINEVKKKWRKYNETCLNRTSQGTIFMLRIDRCSVYTG